MGVHTALHQEIVGQQINVATNSAMSFKKLNGM